MGALRLLLVDDDPFVVRVLTESLGNQGFAVQSAPSAAGALDLLAAAPPFDLVLSDIRMPGMSGMELLRLLRRDHPDTGVVMVTGVDDLGTALEAVRLGASDYLVKPVVLEDLPRTLERACEKNRLLRLLAGFSPPRKGTESAGEEVALESVVALVDGLEERDTFSGGHCRRVALYSDWLVEGMGLTPAMRGKITLAARLHDLGRLLVGGDWLNTPGPLRERERQLILRHSEQGAEALREVLGAEPLACVRFHHERWDGGGYPDGLAGHRIPVGARVIALADAFDAMTSNRSFRALRTPGEALAEISSCAGSQFDPALVPLFHRKVAERIADALPAR
jgi:putative two-component system response regulator